MPPSPSLVQWMTAIGLLILLAWVLLSFLWDVIPVPWRDTSQPQKRIVGVVLLVLIGGLNYSLAGEVLEWVWMGIRHLLGLDLEGL